MADFSMAWSDGSLAGERIVKLSGPFTLSAVFEFQDAIRTTHSPITIVDLSDVPYMDSAAMGSLMGLHVSCHQHDRRYSLVGASDRLRTVFRVSGVDSILSLHGSLHEAEAALGGRVASA
jgi:anti-anti-sigma factor